MQNALRPDALAAALAAARPQAPVHTTISDLPSELLARCLAPLSINEKLFVVPSVAKAWARALRESTHAPEVWGDLDFGELHLRPFPNTYRYKWGVQKQAALSLPAGVNKLVWWWVGLWGSPAFVSVS